MEGLLAIRACIFALPRPHIQRITRSLQMSKRQFVFALHTIDIREQAVGLRSKQSGRLENGRGFSCALQLFQCLLKCLRRLSQFTQLEPALAYRYMELRRPGK